MPGVCCDGVECEELGDLCRRHGALHVLFVGQNKNGCVLKVLCVKTRGERLQTPLSVSIHIYRTGTLTLETPKNVRLSTLGTKYKQAQWNI